MFQHRLELSLLGHFKGKIQAADFQAVFMSLQYLSAHSFCSEGIFPFYRKEACFIPGHICFPLLKDTLHLH